MARHESIEPILKRVPRKPGVYQFFDEEGAILYVGKGTTVPCFRADVSHTGTAGRS